MTEQDRIRHILHFAEVYISALILMVSILSPRVRIILSSMAGLKG